MSGVRLVAFDEVRGFEDPSSRTSSILREWRQVAPRPLFVLAIAGTLFGASPDNACNFVHNLGYSACTPTCESVADHLGATPCSVP